jgi:hypothetical protein
MNAHVTFVLDQVIAQVAPIVAPGTPVPRCREADHDVSVVATALLRRGLLQAQAVHAVVSSASADAAVPNLRSLFEAFGELNYLLNSPDSQEKAQTAFAFALRQIENYQERWRDDDADLSKTRAELTDHATRSPAAFQQASQRRNFWTPNSRAELIDAALATLPRSGTGPLPPEVGKQLYKLLSWDDHHVMSVLLSIDLLHDSPSFGRIRAGHVMEQSEEFIPLLAFIALEGMRQWYVARFPEAQPSEAA